jgi:zinc transporter ZupT
VIARDFSDGINTVNLSLLGATRPDLARRWLIADALAPLVGILTTRLVQFPEGTLSPLLASFSGAFLYIGAGKLVPESYRGHPLLWTTLTTVLGFAAIYLVISLSHS